MFRLEPGQQMIGRELGHYLILKKFRADAMVEVYLAQDTALGSMVTLKFFSAETHKTIKARRHFLSDARAAVALDHPNVCRIYEVGKIEDRTFVAMEYVDGVTLKDRLRQAAMPTAAVLRIGCEVAEALAEAHEKGIFHRNLKPSNIILTQEGHAKVTDFGLSREVVPAARLKNQKDPIIALSRSGVTAGDLAYYLSPEQLRGEKGDARSDTFAFGMILYEMLAKVHPFKKQTAVETINAILNTPPQSLAELNPAISPELQQIVERMLAKDPPDRCQPVREIQIILKKLLDESTQPVRRQWVPVETRQWIVDKLRQRKQVKPLTWKLAGSRKWIAVAGLALLVVLIWAIVRFVAPLTASLPPPQPVVPPATCPTVEDGLSLSPDGKWVAFRWNGDNQGNWDIYIRELDGARFHRMTTDTAEECCPAWSPDGRQIAFLRRLGDSWTLHVISRLDGSERKLTPVSGPSRLSWSPDGKRIALADRGSPAGEAGLWSVSVDMLERTSLTDPSSAGFSDDYPAYSPDGRHLAFIRRDAAGRSAVHVMQLPGGEITPLTDSHSPITLCWTGDSREIVFSSAPDSGEMSLWRIALDGKEPRKVPPVCGEHVWGPAISGGRLACLNSPGDYEIWRMELTGIETLKSSRKPLLISTSDDLSPSISPDGKKIVFVSTSSGSREIWVCGSDGTTPRRLTDMQAGSTGSPRWSPDGKQIAFDSTKAGSNDIYAVGAEGWPVRRVTTDSSEEAVPRWSRDGRWIYFGSNRSGNWEIWKLPSEGGEAVQMTKEGGLAALESNDGRYLYYQPHYLQKKGVWRVPVTGGAESLVLDGVESHLLWDLTDKGIFFINRAAKPRATISFYDFATQRVNDLSVDGDHRELEFAFGLNVFPDGKWLVYSGAFPRFDITSVDNFR